MVRKKKPKAGTSREAVGGAGKDQDPTEGGSTAESPKTKGRAKKGSKESRTTKKVSTAKKKRGPAAEEGDAGEKKDTLPKKGKGTKKKTPRKKRARKKARKKAESEASAAAEASTEAGAPPDGDTTASSPPPSEEPEAPAPPEAGEPEASAEILDADADVGPVQDLDADLDEDDGEPDDVDRLIAETLAVAAEEEGEPEPEAPVIDLDAPVAESVDQGTPAEPTPPEELEHEPAREVEAEVGPEPETERQAAGSEPGIEGDEGPDVVPGGTLGTSSEEVVPEAEAAVEAPARTDREAVSTPEFRERLLAQALAHAEHKDAGYRVPFSDARRINRWKGLIASVMFVAALGAGLAPPSWVRPDPPPPLTRRERARGIRLALFLQAQQIEAYRVRSQRLPVTLDELPARLPGVAYAHSGNRAFQLIAYEPDGHAIVYDSSSPAAPFAALAGVWAPDDQAR